jgi:hypothetical protein
MGIVGGLVGPRLHDGEVVGAGLLLQHVVADVALILARRLRSAGATMILSRWAARRRRGSHRRCAGAVNSRCFDRQAVVDRRNQMRLHLVAEAA